jgi:PTH1 family peptidyl-tRNA hydrolase
MWLFVGLGNPGSQYRHNRHNIGFMAADEIARRHKFSPWKNKFKGEVADGVIGGEKVLLLKPLTFMNDSGESVQAASAFHKIAPEKIVVFYDELDLAPGKIRVKKGGGAGGHNGIRSIDAHMPPDYWRVRLGIGHPGDKNLVTPYVLGDFFKEEVADLEKFLETVAEHAAYLVDGKTDDYMTKVAQAVQPPRENKKKEEKNGL